MNKETILERLTALEAEAKQLREILEAPEKKERWRAEKNGQYYAIDDESFIVNLNEANSDVDKNRYNTFNYFQTKEEAERIARVQLAYRRLDWAIRQFDIVSITEPGYEFELTDIELRTTDYTSKASSLPKLENKKDAEYILAHYKEELMTFLTGGEK